MIHNPDAILDEHYKTWFKNELGIDATKFQNEFSRTDWFGIEPMTQETFIIECKYRPNWPSDSTRDINEGYLIEEDKYNHLLAIANETNSTPLYIMFFCDGKARVFNLNHIDQSILTHTTKYCPRTSYTMAKHTSHKNKQIILLPSQTSTVRPGIKRVNIENYRNGN